MLMRWIDLKKHTYVPYIISRHRVNWFMGNKHSLSHIVCSMAAGDNRIAVLVSYQINNISYELIGVHFLSIIVGKVRIVWTNERKRCISYFFPCWLRRFSPDPEWLKKLTSIVYVHWHVLSTWQVLEEMKTCVMHCCQNTGNIYKTIFNVDTMLMHSLLATLTPMQLANFASRQPLVWYRTERHHKDKIRKTPRE